MGLSKSVNGHSSSKNKRCQNLGALMLVWITWLMWLAQTIGLFADHDAPDPLIRLARAADTPTGAWPERVFLLHRIVVHG